MIRICKIKNSSKNHEGKTAFSTTVNGVKYWFISLQNVAEIKDGSCSAISYFEKRGLLKFTFPELQKFLINNAGLYIKEYEDTLVMCLCEECESDGQSLRPKKGTKFYDINAIPDENNVVLDGSLQSRYSLIKPGSPNLKYACKNPKTQALKWINTQSGEIGEGDIPRDAIDHTFRYAYSVCYVSEEEIQNNSYYSWGSKELNDKVRTANQKQHGQSIR